MSIVSITTMLTTIAMTTSSSHRNAVVLSDSV